MPEHPLFSAFSRSLIDSKTGSRFSFSDYFKTVYSASYDFNEILPCLLSRCDVSVTAPFFYEAADMDALCLIHTTGGAGRLLYYKEDDSTAYELKKGTLAFIDCNNHYKLACPHGWEYTICFVSSPISRYYYGKLEAHNACLFHLETDSDALSLWRSLLHITGEDEAHALMRSQKLTALYAQIYLSNFAASHTFRHIPSYIMDMKRCFDTACEEQYSLDALSAKYQVNKFRLCREFSKYYEDTPLQYLNGVRIRKAKDLLLHSDEKIGIIGQLVGIENANHFIRLFKEKTGVTPLTYRRETPLI
ncbi:MAG: helix-turn-helix transcriptional regulator [Bacillus sp. (in: Bacteria)]|nr:helix-turn-helix transcriptional regulator [Bacillus sp. (in: firmicutes)]MCM1427187.1 helix-turn-helix transcriptional regulator [Eubacterium sp.]